MPSLRARIWTCGAQPAYHHPHAAPAKQGVTGDKRDRMKINRRGTSFSGDRSCRCSLMMLLTLYDGQWAVSCLSDDDLSRVSDGLPRLRHTSHRGMAHACPSFHAYTGLKSRQGGRQAGKLSCLENSPPSPSLSLRWEGGWFADVENTTFRQAGRHT